MTSKSVQANEKPEVLSLSKWEFKIPVVYTRKGPYIPIRPICRQLGVAHNAQLKRLRTDPFYQPWIEEDLPVRTRGGIQIATCIHARERLPMWLATINTNRAQAGAKEALDSFKIDLAREAGLLFYGVVDAVPSLGNAIAGTGLVSVDQRRAILEFYQTHTPHGTFLEGRVEDLEIDVADLQEDYHELRSIVESRATVEPLDPEEGQTGDQAGTLVKIHIDVPKPGGYTLTLRHYCRQTPELIGQVAQDVDD